MTCPIEFKRFMHIGAIVKDLDKTLEEMKKLYELQEYRISDFPPQDVPSEEIQTMYNGKPGNYTGRMCFLNLGNTEIELIQPVSGDSVWADHLANKGDGLHHLKFEVESINESIKQFAALGIKCLQYGTGVGINKGKTWAYFDTEKALGYIVETLNTQVGEIVDKSLL